MDMKIKIKFITVHNIFTIKDMIKYKNKRNYLSSAKNNNLQCLNLLNHFMAPQVTLKMALLSIRNLVQKIYSILARNN